MITAAVRTRVEALAASGDLPAYVVDLADLDAHLAGVRAALPPAVELFYAAKANPAGPVLSTVAAHVDGIEVASAGELAHVRGNCPQMPVAFGGPGKTEAELRAALLAGADVVHVEGVHELGLLAMLAQRSGRTVDVLLRINPRLPGAGPGPGRPALVMGGIPSPFGLDPEQADRCVQLLRQWPWLRLRGVHAHLASGLDADQHLTLSAGVLEWATGWAARHGIDLSLVTLGGGMSVNYADPGDRFDWAALGSGLAALAERHPGPVLRIEPGRALVAYAGWYAAAVTDVRPSHGDWFAVIAGGTHHLRTPAARGHDQPFVVVHHPAWTYDLDRPTLENTSVTVVGALCTPRDVLARARPVRLLRAGDVVAFAMAGAYAWNISHHDFLMHPPPGFFYLPVATGPSTTSGAPDQP